MSDFAWIVTTVVVVAILALGVLLLRLRVRQRRRRLPARIGGVSIEALPVQCIEDLIVERIWRVPLVMTNVTNRPAPVPPLAARSEIRTGRKTFAASTSIEADVAELNPASELVGWVEVLMPAEELPRRVVLTVLDEGSRPGLRLTASLEPASKGAFSTARSIA